MCIYSWRSQSFLSSSLSLYCSQSLVNCFPFLYIYIPRAISHLLRHSIYNNWQPVISRPPPLEFEGSRASVYAENSFLTFRLSSLSRQREREWELRDAEILGIYIVRAREAANCHWLIRPDRYFVDVARMIHVPTCIAWRAGNSFKVFEL